MRLGELFTFNNALVATIVLAFLFLAFKLYNEYRHDKKARVEHDDASNRVPNQDAEVTLILFYADWCPACQKIKPAWNAFAEKYRSDTQRIRGYQVTCQNMNCSEYENDSAVRTKLDKFGVGAFPTIVLVGAGDTGYERYNGVVTQQALEAFVGHAIGMVNN